MLTGIGLALGFAVVNGIVPTLDRITMGKIRGEAGHVAWRPHWLQNLIHPPTSVDYDSSEANDEQLNKASAVS
jgi:hypothetical protein